MPNSNFATAARKLRASAFCIFLLRSSTVFGAGAEDIEFTKSESIPPHVVAAFAKFPASEKYAFTAHVNPFFVQGDFNGDGKLDTAIFVKEKATGKIGIAIVLGGSNSVTVLGAGRSFGDHRDNVSWVDAWYTHAKGRVAQGFEEGAPPNLIGDAIMVIKTESASSLIYWSGGQYRWYQQGD